MTLIDAYSLPSAPVLLYQLLAERSTEDDPYVNISHRVLPSPAEHMAFFMSRPYVSWDMIEHDGVFIGYVSATDRNELGIVLFKDWQERGLGTEALRLFMQTHDPLLAVPGKRSGRWLANIHPQNERSQHLFCKLGFRLIQQTYAYEP